MECRLCNVVSNGCLRPVEDTLLFETELFEVIPTIGQFVSGWLMVVSKKHSRCARDMPYDELRKLSQLIRITTGIVEKFYGPTLIFEHGPGNSPLVTGGCCVEHTHIHIVPCNDQRRFLSLIPFQRVERCRLSQLPGMTSTESGYLLVSTIDSDQFFDIFSILEPVPRQFLRQVLAVVASKQHIWDWRHYPCYENIRTTIARLSKCFEELKELINDSC